jgi:hypothetical protein
MPFWMRTEFPLESVHLENVLMDARHPYVCLARTKRGRLKMSFLFGQTKLNQSELRNCLDWIGKYYKLWFFQDREAELYNNVLLSDLNSVNTSPASAKKVIDASNRLVHAAESLVTQHAKIQSVPEAAASDHYALGLVLLHWKSWAIASHAALEATSKGASFNAGYIQRELQELNDTQLKEKKEAAKLIKLLQRSGAKMVDIQKLMNEATQYASNLE